jgi:homospermidine synthase
MIRNRREGVKIPDQLPHEEVMEVALPYLAPVISKPVDWMPAGPYPADDPRAWEFMRFFVTSTPRE